MLPEVKAEKKKKKVAFTHKSHPVKISGGNVKSSRKKNPQQISITAFFKIISICFQLTYLLPSNWLLSLKGVLKYHRAAPATQEEQFCTPVPCSNTALNSFSARLPCSGAHPAAREPPRTRASPRAGARLLLPTGAGRAGAGGSAPAGTRGAGKNANAKARPNFAPLLKQVDRRIETKN